jgi:F-type H+-transporting ATPase subunit epsilon
MESTGTLKLNLMSPERRLLDGVEVSSIGLNGSEGQIQILPQHAAMVGTLETGPFSVKYADGRVEKGVISTGFFEVRGDTVTVLAETAELASEIDVGRAKAAQKKAEQMLSDAALTPDHFRKYQLKLQRAVLRQSVGGNGSAGSAAH